MTRPRKPRTPKYRLHKSTGQSVVEIDGHRHYLGKHGTPESKEAYHRLVAEWLSGGYSLPVPQNDLTVFELADAYLEHAKVYYRNPRTGEATSTLAEVRVVVEDVTRLYGLIPAVTFGPIALRAVRHGWIERGATTTTINSYTTVVRRLFRWGVSQEMVPAEVANALASLPGLRRGRGVGKDPSDRTPAPLAAVEAVLPHLSRQLAAVVRLLQYTGARPSEILNLKRGDIDCTGDVWVAVLREHKTQYRGKERRLFFGPRSQGILKPFLLRPDAAYLFSPKEAEAERHALEREETGGPGRRPNQRPNPKKTDRVIGDCYDRVALNRAIRRICKAKSITRWTPYQLRHLAATTIEASADLATASAILGHSGLDITQVYVHRDSRAAAAWAAVHG